MKKLMVKNKKYWSLMFAVCSKCLLSSVYNYTLGVWMFDTYDTILSTLKLNFKEF